MCNWRVTPNVSIPHRCNWENGNTAGGTFLESGPGGYRDGRPSGGRPPRTTAGLGPDGGGHRRKGRCDPGPTDRATRAIQGGADLRSPDRVRTPDEPGSTAAQRSVGRGPCFAAHAVRRHDLSPGATDQFTGNCRFHSGDGDFHHPDRNSRNRDETGQDRFAKGFARSVHHR
ncbi:hypothetical protein SACE_6184 [Saccharopolyspora erythraea NRRL 2338]|uniref:Uncharacterized protein n=1 Tax=Saccharopolyspora erythraea (strain ATCC 11635 / DSM 40517 / JCM 4748 / NBRC 13426 / NCIMB 8594 / NRRL 2338) TaxID=405948 RepID=A4FMT2_SACEN|nr:hypothetical protein SACE_6184 [Saccharopolyspora erythraea NRRL 2338]